MSFLLEEDAPACILSHMTSEVLFVPETVEEARAELDQVSSSDIRSTSREQFIRAWNSVAYLHPELHPDHVHDADRGWTDSLRFIAVEAWRRAESGELTDVELYPSDAQWCGLCDRIAAPSVEESTRRMSLVQRPAIRVGDIVRFRHPFPDETKSLMVITEWNIDRGFGHHLNTRLNFPPVQLLRFRDIEAVDHVDV